MRRMRAEMQYLTFLSTKNTTIAPTWRENWIDVLSVGLLSTTVILIGWYDDDA